MSHDNFVTRCTDYSSCAENVLFNQHAHNRNLGTPNYSNYPELRGKDLKTPGAAATAQWWTSPSHQVNMKNPKYTKVGFGYSNCEPSEPGHEHIYWTAFYAKE
jgi:uncharacterized protein YkwD